MEDFRKLGIQEEILKAIEKEGITTPTEIQARSIPLVLKGVDIIGGSKTGSGKTLAFGVGIIQNSEKIQKIQALVLTPTRELCSQVAKSIRKFSSEKKLLVTEVYGGVSINPQIDSLRETDVVVGTPGRILDHMQRGTIDFSNVKTIVLDEADIMLDMGFIDDVQRIISKCPEDRQTMMFSATIHGALSRLTKRYMKNPEKISVESHVDASKLKQVYYDIPGNLKFSLLVHLMKGEHGGLVMVFCNTRMTTDFVTDNLNKQGIQSTAIHGGLTQAKREQIMTKFNSNKVFVLVCTDVAARGLDIKGVSHVYNYDAPQDSKQYIHRIGRTARAGKDGIAINLISQRDHDAFRKIMGDSQINIDKMERPFIETVQTINNAPKRRPFNQNRSRPRNGNGPRRFNKNRR